MPGSPNSPLNQNFVQKVYTGRASVAGDRGGVTRARTTAGPARRCACPLLASIICPFGFLSRPSGFPIVHPVAPPVPAYRSSFLSRDLAFSPNVGVFPFFFRLLPPCRRAAARSYEWHACHDGCGGGRTALSGLGHPPLDYDKDLRMGRVCESMFCFPFLFIYV